MMTVPTGSRPLAIKASFEVHLTVRRAWARWTAKGSFGGTAPRLKIMGRTLLFFRGPDFLRPEEASTMEIRIQARVFDSGQNNA